MTDAPKPGTLERWTKLLTAASPLVLALGVLLGAITSTTAAIVGVINSLAIQQVHILTNSLATRTEALARTAGKAEGELKGRQDEVEDQAAKKAAEEKKKGRQ